ncbi:MAG: 30S ribosomal protein S20 [Candidatus Zixiibacteriota bacterium]|nr:MAG: 30S ribosomal protein S20 [candidate division Zixibacteria bacterium]
MPNHKSCKKRMKTSEEQRIRNRAFRSRLRNAIKEVRTETSKDEAQKKLKTATTLLDKAAGYHLIHKKNADRNKSRLTKHVQKIN